MQLSAYQTQKSGKLQVQETKLQILAADKGLWNTAVILDSYHLGETFGTFVHQIYPPCSADHVQPSKCSLGI